MAIKFGTSGWRAIIADEFTFTNVRKVAQAIATYIKLQGLAAKGVVVGYDTRFLSPEFARASAHNMLDNGIKVYLTNRDTPTPVIAYHILAKKAAGGINITASHNPPVYNGIKFSPAYGGPAPVEVTKEIEKNIDRVGVLAAPKRRTIATFDPWPQYMARLKQLVDLSAIRRAHLKIGADVLYGTGRGYLDSLLQQAGCNVCLLHENRDPFFGGLSPEPAPAQLKELIAVVRKKRLHLGLAVDGDADRFGIVDRDGTYLGANEVISLLSEHLMATRPKRKTLARTLATTHMIDALAKRRGLEVVETPVGFKFIGQELAKGECLIGGEESGGLSIAGHVPEKDGILACLLIAEMVALKRKPLSAILKDLYALVGFFCSSRLDFHLEPDQKNAVVVRLQSLVHQKTVGGENVVNFIGTDGYKFIFADESWMMFRVSGTEPVIRCYLEARSKKQLKDLEKLGRKIVLTTDDK